MSQPYRRMPKKPNLSASIITQDAGDIPEPTNSRRPEKWITETHNAGVSDGVVPQYSTASS
jgi:hypothetical protein